MGHGWCIEGRKLNIEWITSSPVPEKLPLSNFFRFELFVIDLTVTVKFFERKKK